jgi:hypothetical protein
MLLTIGREVIDVEVAHGVHRLTGGVCNFYLLEDGASWCWSTPARPATGR